MHEGELLAIISRHEAKNPKWFNAWVEGIRAFYKMEGSLNEREKKFLLDCIEENNMEK